MRRVLFWVGGIVLILIASVALLVRVPALQDLVVERVLAGAVRSSADDLLREDALRVLLCGTSSPFPHPERAKSCTAVFAAGRFWVVDTGPGSWNRLALWRIPPNRIGAILLTHFHSDHIGELGEFNLQTWVGGRPDPLQVFGPPGVGRVVAGFGSRFGAPRPARSSCTMRAGSGSARSRWTIDRSHRRSATASTAGAAPRSSPATRSSSRM
jgi:ribonuclease Z